MADVRAGAELARNQTAKQICSHCRPFGCQGPAITAANPPHLHPPSLSASVATTVAVALLFAALQLSLVKYFNQIDCLDRGTVMDRGRLFIF